jgi:hypothetical protein
MYYPTFRLLGDYFYYFIIETVGGEDISAWKFSVLAVEQLSHQERELVNKLCSKVCSLGFKLVDQNLAHIVIPEVETELINSGKVTIFNCLFTDITTRYY